MVSIKDIAKLVGMSPSTVSRVINGKKYVRPEIRKTILDLVEQTGYVPNKAARSMVLQRSFTVGLIAPDTFNMFQRQLFSVIEHRLENFGYNTLFFFVKFDGDSEDQCLNRLKSEHVDGVILLHEITDQRFYDYLNVAKIPAVIATFERPGADLCAIRVDERLGAREAVDHIISLGHKKIALISADGYSFGRDRALGYKEALENAGLEWSATREKFAASFTPGCGRAAMRSLLETSRKDFTALFAATDELAIGAIRAIRDAGLRVPEDISIVGFDDIDISAYLSPSLTTIRQPLIDLGTIAANLVHSQISGESVDRIPIILPHELIVRESAIQLD